MNEDNNRIVVLVDMDCFYVQVEERERPENRGKPGAVVQYKNWKGGGIIAVNYEARANGITRQMRGDEARERNPNCILYRVPEQRGKADLTKYRNAGKEVIDVLGSYGVVVERASIDEAYLDVTSVINQLYHQSACSNKINPEELPNTYVVGCDDTISSSKFDNSETNRGLQSWLESISNESLNERNCKLGLAAVLCEKMRAAVYEKTGFRCSAGLANNKMLAKLACGLHKPNKQTVLPMETVAEFFKTFPLQKVRHLGGKLGLALKEQLNCTTMGDIANISENTLQQHFDDKTGTWLYWYARGIDNEPVNSRLLPKSVGCNKNFTGNAALDTTEKIKHWLGELCAEVAERLEIDRETNKRTAKLLTITVRLDGDIRPSSYTRSLPLPASYDVELMTSLCFSVMNKENPSKQSINWNPMVVCLGVSASKFVDNSTKGNTRIDSFFSKKEHAYVASRTIDAADAEAVSRTGNSDIDIFSSDSESTVEIEGTDTTCTLSCHQTITEEVVPSSSITQSEVTAQSTFSLLDSEEIKVNSVAVTEEKRNADNASTKTGFFAKRVKKQQTLQPVIVEESSCDSSEPFSIQELFPNLNEVDEETIAIFPLHIQRKIQQALKDNNLESGKLVTCDKCEKQFLAEELNEHKDFHLAFELQNEIFTQPSTSKTALSATTKPIKRPIKESKKKLNKDSKRSRTIDSFFNAQNSL